MTIHNSTDFRDLIEATAQHFKLRPVFIEKDYWVTLVLRQLSTSPYAEKVVFKGGTSLSKAYKIISRFSEDIDLALIREGYTASQLKSLLKRVTNDISRGLIPIPGHPLENKLGMIRTTVHGYNKVVDSNDFGVVNKDILIEINSFANPVPFEECHIESFISEFLRQSDNQDLISEHKLEPFKLKVLSLQRTYFEKLLAINRLSYEPLETLQKKVRHFYDIYQLHHNSKLKGQILSGNNFELLKLVREDDEGNNTMDGAWKQHCLSDSPLFKNLESTWQQLSPQYLNGLKDLVFWGVLPSPEEVLSTLVEIRDFIQQFDVVHPVGE